ncbi:MAG: ABC transporter ATP-binding protein [Armatimonadota bacterium]|nr:ABC transporter ATP-binding protein [Armatimonadota bacterium]
MLESRAAQPERGARGLVHGSDGVAITLERVNMAFDQHGAPLHVISDLNLTVRQGEFVVLLGPSGCGKSTLLRLVADILQPTTGTITVLGKTPAEARRERALGFVFQQPVLLPWLTAEDNVGLPLRIGGWGQRHTPAATPAELLRLVGLEGFNRARPGQLSGGMQQRVSIARALVSNPRILLMDEPFGALDAITRDRLNEELLRIWSAVGCTIIFVTHSIAEAVYLPNRVVVLSPRPASIRRTVEITLPYPRLPAMKDTPQFLEHSAALRAALEEE